MGSARRAHNMRFGAELIGDRARFQLWAPDCAEVALRLEGEAEPRPMNAEDCGFKTLNIDGIAAGTRYRFVLPDGSEIADPAARAQPDGPEGWSELTNPAAYPWQDTGWTGRPWEEAVIYECHVGSFTPEGTFRAAVGKLDALRDLGITALQLMPLAQCYGTFNWGYDGVQWFAPACAYGRPDDLKALVDAAHARGIMMFLDVVYNHLGKVGSHLQDVAPVLSTRHKGPWGSAMNFDAAGSDVFRAYVVENALYWLNEFSFDGLRLDAVHTLYDTSNTHILELIAARARASRPHRQTHLIVENSENSEDWLERDRSGRPVHYTAQWNDDLHHVLHAALTGEDGGPFADYDDLDDAIERLGRALTEGFVYQGQVKPDEGSPRGEPSAGLPLTAFVSFIQNHDQVGNRVTGRRIGQITSTEKALLGAAISLLSPQIPMLFMGEEWDASTPFPFFSDMPEEKRRQVLDGRKEQLKETAGHAEGVKPDVDETPDPTDKQTFRTSKLDWSERDEGEHRRVLETYRTLIAIRAREIAPRLAGLEGFASDWTRIGECAVAANWRLGDGACLHLQLNLSDSAIDGVPPVPGRVLWQHGSGEGGSLGPWSGVWSLEETEV